MCKAKFYWGRMKKPAGLSYKLNNDICGVVACQGCFGDGDIDNRCNRAFCNGCYAIASKADCSVVAV